MAHEIRIDLDPKAPITYTRKISIPTPNGAPLTVTFTFLHRDADQMAELQESWAERGRILLKAEAAEEAARDAERKRRIADGEDPKAVALDEPLRLLENTRKKRDNDADAIMDVATDWDLKAPSGTRHEFTRDKLVRFLALYQAAAMTIIGDYRISMTEGRLGN
jgi:hypothetical protein